jgi:hypothetical protein
MEKIFGTSGGSKDGTHVLSFIQGMGATVIMKAPKEAVFYIDLSMWTGGHAHNDTKITNDFKDSVSILTGIAPNNMVFSVPVNEDSNMIIGDHFSIIPLVSKYLSFEVTSKVQVQVQVKQES